MHRRLAILGAHRELAGILSMWEYTGVGAEGNRQARLERPRETRARPVPQLALTLDFGWRNAKRRSTFEDRSTHEKRRRVISVVRFQMRNGFVVQHGAMIDGPDTGFERGVDAGRAVRVRGDVASPTTRLLDRHAELLLTVLLRARRDTLRQHCAGGEYLDEVGALLQVRADGLADLIHAVGQIAHDRHVEIDRKLPGVARAACGRHVIPGDLQSRARNGSS